MKRIAIFASGSGSNAENIITYFQNNKKAKVVCVLSNNPNARVLERATNLGVKNGVFNKGQLNDPKWAIENLKNFDLIVLAGFLWKFPDHILENYQNKVVNVHPALLPKFGGKGMYGENIYKAVLENKEVESGISIHFVNQNYDEGEIIFQESFILSPDESLNSLTTKVHELEQSLFPKIIEKTLLITTLVTLVNFMHPTL